MLGLQRSFFRLPQRIAAGEGVIESANPKSDFELAAVIEVVASTESL